MFQHAEPPVQRVKVGRRPERRCAAWGPGDAKGDEQFAVVRGLRAGEAQRLRVTRLFPCERVLTGRLARERVEEEDRLRQRRHPAQPQVPAPQVRHFMRQRHAQRVLRQITQRLRGQHDDWRHQPRGQRAHHLVRHEQRGRTAQARFIREELRLLLQHRVTQGPRALPHALHLTPRQHVAPHLPRHARAPQDKQRPHPAHRPRMRAERRHRALEERGDPRPGRGALHVSRCLPLRRHPHEHGRIRRREHHDRPPRRLGLSAVHADRLGLRGRGLHGQQRQRHGPGQAQREHELERHQPPESGAQGSGQARQRPGQQPDGQRAQRPLPRGAPHRLRPRRPPRRGHERHHGAYSFRFWRRRATTSWSCFSSSSDTSSVSDR
ncbi:hypothetical protein COEX109129_41070 [Corallococcus exiguus]